MSPTIGFYGDDFTGSIDALLQYRRTGLRGVVFTDPAEIAAADLSGWDVVGIAGVGRGLPVAELAGEVLPALRALAALAPRLVQYKACSTADSSPEIGSLGRAIELGRQVLGEHPVAVLLAQPDFGRYTVFGTHFAADGDRIHRLDRHPTMTTHPVTPIGEADLTRHLGAQTDLPIGSLPFTSYDRSEAEQSRLLGDRTGGEQIVVMDALDDRHLVAAGRAILGQPQRPVFGLGSGGLSRAVGLALTGTPVELGDTAQPAPGPVLVVSGSASRRTWQQVEDAVGHGWQPVDVLAEPTPWQLAAAVFTAGRSVVAYTSAPGGRHEPDGERIADRLARTVSEVAAAGGLTRLVVAGGDTSGRVLRRLGVTAIEILATPWGNAALCRAIGAASCIDGVELVLKGGQMGGTGLFESIRTGGADGAGR